MYTRVTRIVLVFCCCYPFELEATPLAQTGGKTYPLYLRKAEECLLSGGLAVVPI